MTSSSKSPPRHWVTISTQGRVSPSLILDWTRKRSRGELGDARLSFLLPDLESARTSYPALAAAKIEVYFGSLSAPKRFRPKKPLKIQKRGDFGLE